jgi:protein-S-isoprenylcysteine O-methyltransferase Ste14
MTALGWAFAFRLVFGLVLMVLLTPPLLARIYSEERLLEMQFGEEYRAYTGHTSRLLPGIY